MTLNRNNSKKDEQSPNKADFSRKNMVAEAPIHNFDKILNNLN